MQRLNHRGFTIVELMIALTVLATLLLIATIVLVNLGGLFSKGTNEANTQNATRNLVNDIVGQIKLGPNTPTLFAPANPDYSSGFTNPSGVGVLCIGNQRYTYMLNSELGVSPSKHAVWRDTLQSSGSCAPVANFTTDGDPTDDTAETNAVAGSGSELLPNHTRLVSLNITKSTSATDTWNVSLELAYGDSDLLTYNAPYVLCKGGSGDQYCATAALTGTATQRLQ